MKTLLIAEDHKIFNDGLKTLLSADFEVLYQVFDGNEVLAAVQKFNPQILLLDINLPHKNGLDIGREVKISYPNTKLVYLSMYAEQSFLKTAKEIGADGYLLKDTNSYEMVEAIKKIEEGQKVFDLRLNEPHVNLHHEDHFVRQYSLSKREIEVIAFIKQSLSTEQIAAKMCISYETVKSHRKNIFLKLGFNKSSELVQFAIEHGI